MRITAHLDRYDRLDMAPRGDFRDHAAVGNMERHARRYHIAEQPPAVFDYSGCRLVATRLNAQHAHITHHTLLGTMLLSYY